MTRVAIIDSQPAVRAGLGMLLLSEPGIVPVGAAAGASDGPDLLSRERFDDGLLDHGLRVGDGIALCRRVKGERAYLRLILSTSSA